MGMFLLDIPSGNFGGNSQIAKVFHENIQNDQKNEWVPRFIATEFWERGRPTLDVRIFSMQFE
jgi:hypothetical protein